MATTYGAYFGSSTAGTPKASIPNPRQGLGAGITDVVSETVDVSASLTANGDIYGVFPLPYGTGTILNIKGEFAELDAGSALDMDLVLVDTNGTTVLYDASAESNQIGRAGGETVDFLANQTWDSGTGTALPAIALRATTAPTTDQDGVVTLQVEYVQRSTASA